MTRNSFIFGALMIALAIGFHVATGMASKTALIPAGFGAILLICGAVGLGGEKPRKHAMHVAAMVSLLGVLSIGRALPKLLQGDFSPAPLEMLLFAVLSLVFLILCIQSFIAARKARQAGGSYGG